MRQVASVGRQANTLKQMVNSGSASQTPKVLAVSSGKGGVGKTSLVANLAYELGSQGFKVLIFDADIGLNNIDILLGLASHFHIGHVLSGEKKLEEVIIQGPNKIDVLPASNGWQELTTLDNEKKMVLMDRLDRVSFNYDYIIFDTGAGISSNVTYFCSAAHEIILVATTEPTSHTDVYALMKVLFQNHHQKRFRLIVNSVKNEREAKEVFQRLSDVVDRFLTHVSIDYFGFVLYDPNVSRAVRQQKAILELYPHSSICGGIQKLCKKLIKERNLIPESSDRPFLWNQVFQVQ